MAFVIAELKSWSTPLLSSTLRRGFHEVPAAVNDNENREKSKLLYYIPTVLLVALLSNVVGIQK